MGCVWYAYELAMEFMGYQVHHLGRVCSFIVVPMRCLGDHYGMSMGCVWNAYGLAMECVYGVLERVAEAYGLPMGCTWKHVGGVCIAYGILMVSIEGYPYRKAQPFLCHTLPFLEVTLSYLSSISFGQEHSDSSFFIFEDCTTSSLLERTVKNIG